MIAAIGVALGSIAVIPIITDWISAPRIEIIRQSVHLTKERVTAEYQILNSGTAIANDIFLQLQTSENDKLFMPFSVKYDIRSDGINWEIDIKSLAPGESTGITLFSPNVSDFVERQRILETLPNPINFVWADYREGRREDIIFSDSPEISESLPSVIVESSRE